MVTLALTNLGSRTFKAITQKIHQLQLDLLDGRAFVMEPKVLLLDEPRSNLDAKLREEMRIELRRLVKSLGVTTIFVTHEQIEALTLSDKIAVIKDGKIEQEGTPLEIYQKPASAFVADFIGKSNLIPGKVTWMNGAATIRVESALGGLACTPSGKAEDGSAIMVAIRPEHLELTSSGEPGENVVQGRLETASFIGNMMDCTVRSGATLLKVQLHPDRTPPVGSDIALYVAPRHCLAMQDA